MLFISSNNEYPRFIGDLQLEYPDWKIGDAVPSNWQLVAPQERPQIEGDKIIYEDFPIEVEGVMTQNWQIRDMTAEEIERRDAPETAKAKLMALGLSELEIQALVRGLI